MSTKYLGNHFDIHTGGEDNIFPHHENEIAQSECASKEKFVNYWLHCRFLLVEGEKMSKSKGNFYTLRDLLNKGYDPVSIRYLLLSHHYRHPLNFTLEGIDQAEKAITRINAFIDRIQAIDTDKSGGSSLEFIDQITEAHAAFDRALTDDLNISEALGVYFDFLKLGNHEADANKIDKAAKQKIVNFNEALDKILAIRKDVSHEVPEDVLVLVDERQTARAQRDFQRADAIRDELARLGWVVKDTKDGAKVERQ